MLVGISKRKDMMHPILAFCINVSSSIILFYELQNRSEKRILAEIFLDTDSSQKSFEVLMARFSSYSNI